MSSKLKDFYKVTIEISGKEADKIIEGTSDYIAKKYDDLMQSGTMFRVTKAYNLSKKESENPLEVEKQLLDMMKTLPKFNGKKIVRALRTGFRTCSQIANGSGI